MPLRRGRDEEPPFPVIGKVGEQPLEVVLELCRPGEQPRFVIGEGIYEKAYDRLDWLRGQIRDARRAADPSIEPAEQLKRMRAAADDDPSAYGLEDPEPFVAAIADVLAENSVASTSGRTTSRATTSCGPRPGDAAGRRSS